MIHFRLKELMRERGVTYRQVSEAAGVSTNTLYKIASNKQRMIGVDVIGRLLVYFNCQPNDLIVLVG